jgi:hypothetical protein
LDVTLTFNEGQVWVESIVGLQKETGLEKEKKLKVKLTFGLRTGVSRVGRRSAMQRERCCKRKKKSVSHSLLISVEVQTVFCCSRTEKLRSALDKNGLFDHLSGDTDCFGAARWSKAERELFWSRQVCFLSREWISQQCETEKHSRLRKDRLWWFVFYLPGWMERPNLRWNLTEKAWKKMRS